MTDTVYIVDDDAAIRSGLSMLLQSSGYETRSFHSGEAFLEHCMEPLPERAAAILDLSMPIMDGLELQSEMQRRNIDIPVVFLSGDGDVPLAVVAVQRGAVDFIEKPVNTNVLLDRLSNALDTTDNGDTGENHSDTQSRLSSLTERERQVLNGIAGGKTSKTIAEDMDISERTVELHRSRVLKKMGVRNSTELLNHILPALGISENRET